MRSAIKGLRLSACRFQSSSPSPLAALRTYSAAAPVTSRARARSSPTATQRLPINETSAIHVETTFDGRPRPITIFEATHDDLPYPSLLVAIFSAAVVTGLVISKYIIADGRIVVVGPSDVWEPVDEESTTKSADKVSKNVWRSINLAFPILSLGGFGSLALVLASRFVLAPA